MIFLQQVFFMDFALLPKNPNRKLSRMLALLQKNKLITLTNEGELQLTELGLKKHTKLLFIIEFKMFTLCMNQNLAIWE